MMSSLSLKKAYVVAFMFSKFVEGSCRPCCQRVVYSDAIYESAKNRSLNISLMLWDLILHTRA